jgi:hypothetical protein
MPLCQTPVALTQPEGAEKVLLDAVFPFASTGDEQVSRRARRGQGGLIELPVPANWVPV